ncbi:MAG TPA: alpha-hydroxy acid oxidase [Bryobacteraceae bacterium]|nr:alpha-hydroxy acid oxidase [Bryobacteraceae bacterium]
MPDTTRLLQNRRRFLAYLAASPLAVGQQRGDVITSVDQALNVFDFEPAARKVLPPAHFGYMSTGVEDDLTLKANRDGFNRFHLRPRRLVDVTHTDLRTKIFGVTWDSPIGLAPIGNAKAFHPEGELPTARAAKSRRALQILSTASNTSFEEISATLGRPPWYQLYPTSRWEFAEKIVHRVQDAGCEVLLITVDTQAGRRLETFERMRLLDKRDCTACHGTKRSDFYRRKPMFQGLDTSDLQTQNPALTWEHIRRLRKMTRMKLLVKGIETAEDAKLCLENGADGLVISNHGGRAGETGRGTIECLPEVVDAVHDRLTVLIDGGFRRGSDVFKALALGAKAVLVGRPYIWGLAAFGQEGVEKVLDLLKQEVELVMKQCGTTSIASIGSSSIGYNKGR